MTPNTQITQANVGLLKAGDVVRLHKAAGPSNKVGDLFVFADAADPEAMRIRLREYGNPDRPPVAWHASRFTYIGPDLGDDWIGWSGGREPVPHDTPGLIVRCRSGAEHIAAGFASHYWQHDGDGCDIVAFKFSRPALSPPAEGEIRQTPWNEYRQTFQQQSATPTPAAVDHIGDATEMMAVDWERVGPKLVEALERIRANDPNDPAQPWNVARDAIAAAQSEGK